jgi:hypothetical protein
MARERGSAPPSPARRRRTSDGRKSRRRAGPEQIPRFEELERQACEVDLDGLAVRVCSLEHLLEMKRASDRIRDQDDVQALEGIQKADQDLD